MMILLLSNPVVINLSGDWISAVAEVLMLVLTTFSVCCAFRAYIHQKERSKKEAACKLAQHYASNVVEKYSRISGVFTESGLFDEIKQVADLRSLNNFDKEELDAQLEARNINLEDLEKKMIEINPSAILQCRIDGAHSVMERSIIMEGYTKTDEDGKRQIINTSYLQNDFLQDIGDLLNELEWFAMNCRYGLADEEILYQSLHQTYLSTVWMLWFYISRKNINNEDKLFTNVIWLFVAWRDRLNKITDESKAQKEELIKRAEAVKPKVFSGTRLK